MPTYSYNGGYYSINPNVLTDFYTANGFTDIRAFVIMWDRYRPYGKQRSLCYEYRSDVLGSRHALADLDQVRYAPHLLLFARKEMAVEEFVAPLQFAGDYANQAAAVSATREQGLEKHARKGVRWLQENLPLGPVLYLQSFAYRWFTFWRARRKAGFRI
ncbi:MAG: hypothetical protein R3F24_12015 [Gammaproteobacteria bacterium]